MHAQTRRQREVFDFISRYIDSHGYRPSYQVIARHMGVRSRAGIARIVHGLEEQGLLTRRRENGHFYLDVGSNSGTSGATGPQIEWLRLPDPDTGDSVSTTPFLLPPFMLDGLEPSVVKAFRVRDDAFAVEHICEDDIILVEVREFARDGQRVVAVLDGARTVFRKCYRAGADLELRTPDEDADVIRLSADRVDIKGLYRGLLRPLS